MSWQKEVDDLRRREAMARAMGGEDKIERQRAAGRLTVRERLARLLDPDSWHEIGMLAGVGRYDADGNLEQFSPSNTLFGRGRIDGRPVVITADDFTVRGGAADASIHEKQIAAERLANEYRLPIVRLVEGTGGGGSVKTIESAGYTYLPTLPGWDLMVSNLATVPVVALGLGPVAGLGAARLVTSHYSILVKDLSQMFVAGPPVVAAVGENLTKEELGGSAIHTRNGAGDWEGWLEFFLVGVRQTAESAVATAQALSQMFAADRSRIGAIGKRAGSALRVHEALIPTHPLCVGGESKNGTFLPGRFGLAGSARHVGHCQGTDRKTPQSVLRVRSVSRPLERRDRTERRVRTKVTSQRLRYFRASGCSRKNAHI